MGEARRRGSMMQRMIEAQERNARAAAELDAKRKSFALEVAAQANRIGMALAPTNLVAQSAPGHAPNTEPARVVMIGLDQLVQRLAVMEKAVDAKCPRGGTDPACQCMACQIRKECGMLWKVPIDGPEKVEFNGDLREPTPETEPVMTSGHVDAPAIPKWWDSATSDPIADIEEGIRLARGEADCPQVIGPETAAAMVRALDDVTDRVDLIHSKPIENGAAPVYSGPGGQGPIATPLPDISAHVALNPEYEPGDCEDTPDDFETREHEHCGVCELDPKPEVE
jgi:hypothetical protein